MLNYQLSRDNFAHNRTIIVAAFRFIFVFANIPQPFDESKGGGGGAGVIEKFIFTEEF